jgi:hypothetical protein
LLTSSEKLYVAHFNANNDLLEHGEKLAAAREFEQAALVDPDLGEAADAPIGLTPTPVPTRTPIPSPTTDTRLAARVAYYQASRTAAVETGNLIE